MALVTTISTSPLLALMISPNFAHTPPNRLRRLFSARVCSRFLTVLSVAGTPAAFSSSATIWLLSDWVRVGALRIVVSLASLVTMLLRLARALAVLSRLEVFTAAVYYKKGGEEDVSLFGSRRGHGFADEGFEWWFLGEVYSSC